MYEPPACHVQFCAAEPNEHAQRGLNSYRSTSPPYYLSSSLNIKVGLQDGSVLHLYWFSYLRFCVTWQYSDLM